MNLTHNGKIGRLPKAVQDQVNRRLEQGESGASIVNWLNTLPEVQAVLAAQFAGKPIREQNVSQWRHHGYQQWLWRQEAQALMAETGALQAPGAPPLSDQMASWVSVRYLMAMRSQVGQNPGDQPNLKLLRTFCRDIVALRRGDHSAARLKMEQEWLGLKQEKTGSSQAKPLSYNQPGKNTQ